MSTIFGIYDPGRLAISEKEVQEMTHAMDYWAPDDRGYLQQDNLFLAHLMLHNTPESLNEKQPFGQAGCYITADARIDNRDEILGMLHNKPPEGIHSPDAALILGLYHRFGKDCVQYLAGDFAFCIWDARSKELFCVRDQIGVKNLFYYLKDSAFVFSSEPRGILALPWVDDDIDEEFVEHLLADTDPDPDRTFHRYIRRLLPGQYLVYSPKGITVSKYWKPELPRLLRLGSRREYFDAFREQLEMAVSCRLRTVFPVSAELSGGLDSSGITCLAASLVRDKDNLYTFSNVMPKGPGGQKPYRDEEEYIDLVIRSCEIRHAVKVHSSGRAYPLEHHDLDIFVNSGVDVYSAAWQDPLRKEMLNRNIRVTLSGFGGDEAVTNKSGWYFKDFLREGEYLKFLRAIHEKRLYGLPFRMLARGMIPDPILQRIYLKRPGYKRKNFLLDTQRSSDLEGRFIRNKQLTLGGFRERILHLITRDYTVQRIQSEGLFSIMRRLEPRFPLMDIRLLQFYLSLPLDIIGNPFQNRYVFRESLKGILPEEVRLRSDKLISAGIYYVQESRGDASNYQEWLRERQASERSGWAKRIDFTKLINGWDSASEANRKDGQFFPPGSFRTECFLRYLELGMKPSFPVGKSPKT